MTEHIFKYIKPGQLPVFFIGLVSLTLLGSYFLLFKKPLTDLKVWQTSLDNFKQEAFDSQPLAKEIAKIKQEIEQAQTRLNGESPELPTKQMVAHIVHELDQISKSHNVQLGSVRPGLLSSIMMFDELPFHIEINGTYFGLYDWLDEVESRLGPIVVKEFEIKPDIKNGNNRTMQLTIASYRQHEPIL